MLPHERGIKAQLQTRHAWQYARLLSDDALQRDAPRRRQRRQAAAAAPAGADDTTARQGRKRAKPATSSSSSSTAPSAAEPFRFFALNVEYGPDVRHGTNLYVSGVTPNGASACVGITGFKPAFYVRQPSGWTDRDCNDFVRALDGELHRRLHNRNVAQYEDDSEYGASDYSSTQQPTRKRRRHGAGRDDDAVGDGDDGEAESPLPWRSELELRMMAAHRRWVTGWSITHGVPFKEYVGKDVKHRYIRVEVLYPRFVSACREILEDDHAARMWREVAPPDADSGRVNVEVVGGGWLPEHLHLPNAQLQHDAAVEMRRVQREHDETKRVATAAIKRTRAEEAAAARNRKKTKRRRDRALVRALDAHMLSSRRLAAADAAFTKACTLFELYEAHIECVVQFLVDRQLRPSAWWETDAFECDYYGIRRFTTDFELWCDVSSVRSCPDDVAGPLSAATSLQNTPPNLLVMMWDIECVNGQGRFPQAELGDPVVIISFSLYRQWAPENRQDYVFVVLPEDDRTLDTSCLEDERLHVHVFDTEADLLLAFRDAVVGLDPDVMGGYNSNSFDWRYVRDRAAALKIKYDWQRLGRMPNEDSQFYVKRPRVNRGRTKVDVIVGGRCVLDLFRWAVTEGPGHNFEDIRLGGVARDIVGATKVDVPPDRISYMYQANGTTRGRLVWYAAIDTVLLQRIDDARKIVPEYLEQSRARCIPAQHVHDRGTEYSVQAALKWRMNNVSDRFYVIPTRRRDQRLKPFDFDGGDVKKPKQGFYDDPVIVLDYASLYPSEMRSRNLCPSTKFVDLRLIERDKLVEGRDFTRRPKLLSDPENESELLYDPLTLRPRSDARPDATAACYLTESYAVGVTPFVLKQLKERRNEFKAKMNDAIRELEELDAIAAARQNGGGAGVVSPQVLCDEAARRAAAQSTRTLMGLREQQIKLLMNSMYGIFGSPTSPLADCDIAEDVTFGGRMLIRWTGWLAEQLFRRDRGYPCDTEVIYGDSVAGETPLLCYLPGGGGVRLCTAEYLYARYGALESYEHDPSGKERVQVRGPVHVWSDGGFTPVRRFIRHRVASPLYRVSTETSSVCVTRDHSLLDVDAQRTSVSELESGVTSHLLYSDIADAFWDSRDDKSNEQACRYAARAGELFWKGWHRHAFRDSDASSSSSPTILSHGDDAITLNDVLPQYILNRPRRERAAFWDANTDTSQNHVATCTSELEAAFVTALARSLKRETRLSVSENDRTFTVWLRHANDGVPKTEDDNEVTEVRLACRRRTYRTPTTATASSSSSSSSALPFADTAFEESTTTTTSPLRADREEYVYDLETGSHHFQAGIGSLIVHNTDSIMVRLVDGHVLDRETIERYGFDMERELNRYMMSPHKIEFEKWYARYILSKKKKYAGLKYTPGQLKPRLDKKGLRTEKRGMPGVEKRILLGSLERLVVDGDRIEAVNYAKRELGKLARGDVRTDELVLGASLKVDPFKYADKNKNGGKSTPGPHVQLARRMALANPENPPRAGDRVHYVICGTALSTTTDRRKQSVGDKATDPMRAMKRKIPIDTRYYVDHSRVAMVGIFKGVLGGERDAERVLYRDNEHMRKRQRTDVSLDAPLSRFLSVTKWRCAGCTVMLSEGAVCARCVARVDELREQSQARLDDAEQRVVKTRATCQECVGPQGSATEIEDCASMCCDNQWARMQARADQEKALRYHLRFNGPQPPAEEPADDAETSVLLGAESSVAAAAASQPRRTRRGAASSTLDAWLRAGD